VLPSVGSGVGLDEGYPSVTWTRAKDDVLFVQGRKCSVGATGQGFSGKISLTTVNIVSIVTISPTVEVQNAAVIPLAYQTNQYD
jgi:hypothetical protein